MQRNMFGLHAPVRMSMERELVNKVSWLGSARWGGVRLERWS